MHIHFKKAPYQNRSLTNEKGQNSILSSNCCFSPIISYFTFLSIFVTASLSSLISISLFFAYHSFFAEEFVKKKLFSTLSKCMSLVHSVRQGDIRVFPNYILPALADFTQSQEVNFAFYLLSLNLFIRVFCAASEYLRFC